MAKKVINLEPSPDLFDRRMSPAEMRRLEKVHGPNVERLMYSRLRCPQCETIYDGQGDVRECMRWHRGETL